MSAPHLQHLAALIANDGHAASFQSLGQYRNALLKEIALSSAEPASPWIKCSDRLPAREQRTVAVLFDDGEPGVAWAGYWSGARTDFAGWQFPVDDLGADRIVTHWMPLPAVPAKGGDGEVQS
ncbi:DUF551 domain-containing protein [Pseudomonas argentinensis]|uniref:DUF551 domain-containing protein n=1 Tax=Phytopseudomonas argentinensis TaxID=289370 RepID=A0A1I3NWM6_9GAMM|nr:DUF551 domain-containing protein [Pseudomonas argentinensis]KAB0549764.1 DUF551 domain-containing protein [Pseudomonas argentinensis]SFJ13420.1 Protein of unknown function [Pseudomonas argentinensis]